MKILMYCWDGFNENILKGNLICMGYDVSIFKMKCKHYTRDMEFAASMINSIHSEGIEAVVSFNYFPIISLVCDSAQIPYYSWVYDCPHLTLFAKTINLPCNHIGIFDKYMVDDLQSRGVNTVFHLPLGADTETFGNVILNVDDNTKKKYAADVSFVGQLYSGDNFYFDRIYKDNEAVYQILKKQCFDYSNNEIIEAILDGRIDFQYAYNKMNELGLMLGDDYMAEPSDIIIPELYYKAVTKFEREELLESVSRINGIDFKLYTKSKTKLQNYGTVGYTDEMPIVFNNSKINLNITLRSIQSGIPLRVLDIMACGGFALSNYQPEIAQYFIEDEEIVMFKSIDECVDKIKYYLENEEERKKIAKAGHLAVQNRMSYLDALKNLFSI